MSSNLLKGRYTYVKSDDTRVIDTNELLARKLEEQLAKVQVTSETSEEGDEDGFTSGLGAEHLGVLFAEMPESGESREELQETFATTSAAPASGATSEELLQEARLEVDRMMQEARAQIEAERLSVLEEAKRAGYEEGLKCAEAEYRSKEQSLIEKESSLNQEYQNLIDSLEPQFIETITGVYEHVFGVELGKYHDILVHLIASTIRKAEGCKEFVVRVSGEDYPYVSMQKKKLQGAVSLPGSFVEIVEDLALKKNECMIETGSGIYDCSLGTELEELSVKLKLLSYERPE